MQDIKACDLKVGDIFAFELKIKGRVAYKVEVINEESGTFSLTDRNTGLPVLKRIDYTKWVKLLKRENDTKKRTGITLQ